MNVMCVFYSRKGKTELLAGMIAEGIRTRGHQVTMVPIEHVKRPGFLGAGRASIKEKEMDLANADADFDLSEADMVVMGGPIFAGRVNPYTRTYVGRVTGMEGKPGGVFITCASKPEDGVRLIEELVRMVSDKGLSVRGRLVGSNKVLHQFPALVEPFLEDLLGPSRGDDGDGEGVNGEGK